MVTQHITYDLPDPTSIRAWKPAHYLASVSRSVSSVLKPAGLNNAKSITSANYLMETSSPKAATDKVMHFGR